MLVLSPNLYNKLKRTDGIVVRKSGTIESASSYAATDYIPVTPGSVIYGYYRHSSGVILQARINTVCAYDSNKNPVEASGSTANDYSYTVPTGIYFIRASFIVGTFTDYMLMADESTIPDLYIPYYKYYTSGFVTPEMYGAVGDGATDDTDAIVNAARQQLPVKFFPNKTYCVSKKIAISCPKFSGNNCKIKLIADIADYVFYSSYSVCIDGFTFDANGHNVHYFIKVGGTGSNIEVHNIILDEFHDTDNTNQSGLIECTSTDSADISNITITNCTKKGNGTVGEAAGSLKGIYIINPNGNVIIHNVYAKNMHNVDDNDDIIIEDCDVIHIATNSKKANVNIHDIYGKDFGRRLIKAQSIASLYIGNVYAEINDFDTLVAIGIGDAEVTGQCNAVIENSTFVNKFTPSTSSEANYCISTSQDCIINNCYFDSEKCFSILNTKNLNVNNCIINGFGVRSQNASRTTIKSIKGKGVYLYYGNSSEFALSESEYEYIYLENVFTLSAQIYISASASDIGLIENCKFANVHIRQSGGIYKYNAISDDKLTYSDGDYAFVLRSNAIASFDDVICKKLGTQTTISKLIDNPSGCVANLKNMAIEGIARICGGSGKCNVFEGVNIETIVNDEISASNVSNIPQWMTDAPSTRYLPDGLLYLSKADGKLYKVVSGEWQAVN